MAAIITYKLRGEKLLKLEIASIFSAMVGVIILTDPFSDGDTSRSSSFYVGIFVALTGAVIAGYAYNLMREIGN